MGCVLYSNENNGKMPPDLGTLLLNEDLTTSVFVSPSSNTGLPPSLNKPEDRAAWINQHSDYVYLGAGKTMDMPNAADTVLAYEKLDIHRGIGANVLFGDGHVQFMRVPDVQRLLENQKAESKP
jgi:prepilin-type processing-associated H-X9-DG protein